MHFGVTFVHWPIGIAKNFVDFFFNFLFIDLIINIRMQINQFQWLQAELCDGSSALHIFDGNLCTTFETDCLKYISNGFHNTYGKWFGSEFVLQVIFLLYSIDMDLRCHNSMNAHAHAAALHNFRYAAK